MRINSIVIMICAIELPESLQRTWYHHRKMLWGGRQEKTMDSSKTVAVADGVKIEPPVILT